MVVREKKWLCNTINNFQAEEIAKELGISTLLAKIFLSRDIINKEEIKRILTCNLKDLTDPFLLTDMEKAVDRIIKAIEGSERILIFGDYDVDGVTSTSILVDFLRKYTKNISYYLPDREQEGYGMTKNALKRALKYKPNLIITVDCGITSLAETKYLKSEGIDIIITDHHQCNDVLPLADCVINPLRKDCIYPFKKLAGVGIAFKLIQAICIKLKLGDVYIEYLDIVTLGTVADVVPIIGENKIIVDYGMKKMLNTENIGLKKLMEISQIMDKKINTYIISFLIAPKINAAGRLGDASRAVELLLTKDIELAAKLAAELYEENKFRQLEEANIIEEAIQMIEKNQKFLDTRILVLAHESWHHGIIGIVASKIVEKYYKPCIIFSKVNGEYKGSARSIEGFNIHLAISYCENILLKYGGHEQAAGLAVLPENLEKFALMINDYANKNLLTELLIPKLKADLEINKSDITLEAVAELSKLEPFGFMNPAPSFILCGLKVYSINAIGNNKHLKIIFKDKNKFIEAIAFNWGHLKADIEALEAVDIFCSMDLNVWQGNTKIQLNLKDYKNSCKQIDIDQYYISLKKLLLEVKVDKRLEKEKLDEYYLPMQKSNDFSERLSKMLNDSRVLIIVNCFNCLKKIKSMLKWSVIEGCVKENYNYLTAIDNKWAILINPIEQMEITIDYDQVIFYGCTINKNYIDKLKTKFINKIVFWKNYNCKSLQESLRINRTDMGYIYKFLKKYQQDNEFVKVNNLSDFIDASSPYIDKNTAYIKFKNAIHILKELDIIKMLKDDENKLEIWLNINQTTKSDLENSDLYKKLNVLF